jgi:hypothetical protein
LCAGCAGSWSPGEAVEGLLDSFQRSLRQPGDKLLSEPASVRREYGCDRRKLPFVTVEEYEVHPTTLSPGDEFNHHFVYALCSEKTARPVIGTLTRQIYFNGKAVFQDVSKNYQLKPGKWSVDAFITVSPKAKPGFYTVQLSFRGGRINFEKTTDLIVKE